MSYLIKSSVFRAAWLFARVRSVLVLTLLCFGQGTGAPQITSADRTTFTIGSGETFTVTSTGVPTPALQATGTLPSGVSFTDNGNGTARSRGRQQEARPAAICGQSLRRIRSSPMRFRISILSCRRLIPLRIGDVHQFGTQSPQVGEAIDRSGSPFQKPLGLCMNVVPARMRNNRHVLPPGRIGLIQRPASDLHRPDG